MTREEIIREVKELSETQNRKRTFDFVAEFVAKAGTAGSVTIPINNAGEFLQNGYNILYTKNSTVTPSGGTAANFCAVKLRMRSQAANNTQSNDFIPVQLIASPGSEDMPRYGSRPFGYFYPKGDALVIEYDNRAPKVLNGETYSMADERISIVFNGKLIVTE